MVNVYLSGDKLANSMEYSVNHMQSYRRLQGSQSLDVAFRIIFQVLKQVPMMKLLDQCKIFKVNVYFFYHVRQLRCVNTFCENQQLYRRALKMPFPDFFYNQLIHFRFPLRVSHRQYSCFTNKIISELGTTLWKVAVCLCWPLATLPSSVASSSHHSYTSACWEQLLQQETEHFKGMEVADCKKQLFMLEQCGLQGIEHLL